MQTPSPATFLPTKETEKANQIIEGFFRCVKGKPPLTTTSIHPLNVIGMYPTTDQKLTRQQFTRMDQQARRQQYEEVDVQIPLCSRVQFLIWQIFRERHQN
mmetsp:Transcript_83118/g.240132  ORF Transcript_83118/g.240132 Transcript_83118/m.240132 type:complete len:101 (-) Transcript_83118:2726-3028(-)